MLWRVLVFVEGAGVVEGASIVEGDAVSPCIPGLLVPGLVHSWELHLPSGDFVPMIDFLESPGFEAGLT